MNEEVAFIILCAFNFCIQKEYVNGLFHHTHIFYNHFFNFTGIYGFLLFAEQWRKVGSATPEDNKTIAVVPVIEKIKYEDKHLADIRKMNKEYVFDENEEKMKDEKYNEFYDGLKVECVNNLNNAKNQATKLKNIIDKNNDCVDDSSADEETEDVFVSDNLTKELNLVLNEEKRLNDLLNGEDLVKQAKKQATEYVIKLKMDKFKNGFIMEHTPAGNVLMNYDADRETFKYYSDNNVPYKYLDVVCRKFVKQFNCRPIYVDMEEEIKMFKEHIEQEKERLEKEKERLEKEKVCKPVPAVEKKRIFAKFKSYNKESGTGHVNTGAPPKNNISNSNSNKKSNEPVILKDKTNRYTYEGKMSNFSFIQKIDKKNINKKLACSFSDFKKQFLQN